MAMNNDITFCLNEECPVKHQCRRGQEPAKSLVSVAEFDYVPVDDGKEVICSGWWSMTNDKH
jgi:hypothetical protein